MEIPSANTLYLWANVIVLLNTMFNVGYVVYWLSKNRDKLFYMVPVGIWLLASVMFHMWGIISRVFEGYVGPSETVTLWAFALMWMGQIQVSIIIWFHSTTTTRAETLEDMITGGSDRMKEELREVVRNNV